MTETRHCPNCGAEVAPGGRFCPQCGSSVEAPEPVPAKEDRPADGFNILSGEAAPAGQAPADEFANRRPATIEELRRYCAARSMPLEKMRFFIGENYQQPRAFGVYEEDGRFTVYKNKADGSRAVRYCGPDEAYAVNELYQKLLEECHNRGIFPERYGMPGGMRGAGSDAGTNAGRSAGRGTRGSRRTNLVGIIVIGVIVLAFVLFLVFKKPNGYYRSSGGDVYYLYGSTWYYPSGDNWYRHDPIGEMEYIDGGYSSDWGVSSFTDSGTYRDIRDREERESRDRDTWSDWDSGGTDWDSDW